MDFKTFSSAYNVDTTHTTLEYIETAKKFNPWMSNINRIDQIERYCKEGLSFTGQLLEQLHDRVSVLEKENKQLVERVGSLEASIKYKKE